MHVKSTLNSTEPEKRVSNIEHTRARVPFYIIPRKTVIQSHSTLLAGNYELYFSLEAKHLR